MNARFYIPQAESLPPWRWLASLDDARLIAHLCAERGERALINIVSVSGRDLDVILAMRHWTIGGGHARRIVPPEHFTIMPLEEHVPHRRIPRDPPEPDIWSVRIINLEEPREAPRAPEKILLPPPRRRRRKK